MGQYLVEFNSQSRYRQSESLAELGELVTSDRRNTVVAKEVEDRPQNGIVDTERLAEFGEVGRVNHAVSIGIAVNNFDRSSEVDAIVERAAAGDIVGNNR